MLTLPLAILSCSQARAVVTFDWANVGNPGNASDTEVMVDGTTGYGGVDHAYRISKHEVTNAQYMEFLNAVAVIGDAYGLYNTSMASTYGGIARTGAGTVGDPFTYSVKEGDINWLRRPVNYVSFFDAMRFTNWLHNGQGSGGTESGVYNISDGIVETRSANAKYWLPSEDEWYKAAYYDASAGVYYNYPMGTDRHPRNYWNDPFPGNNANFILSGYTIDGPYYMTEVGAFENSASPYGTFDQGGNVWEWNEAVLRSSVRGLRGGSFIDFSSNLHASYRYGSVASSEYEVIGFRVATVPEPNTMWLGAVASAGVLLRQRGSDHR